MKTLTTLLFMMFALTLTVEAAGKSKKVSITKVEKAIKDDPEQALKDYTDFEASFRCKDYKPGAGKGVAKVKSKYASAVLFKKLPDKGNTTDRNTYECKLEKYTKADGTEGVRIVVLSQIK